MESGATSDMLRHFHGLYSHRPQLSTNQRARIHSVIVKKLAAYNNPILFSPRPFSFRLKSINCCDNCDDPLFKFVFLDPTSYQHRSVLQTHLWRRNRTIADEKLGSYGRAYFRCHLLHIACDELLEIGINSFFGIGNYDVIQNHVVAFLVDTSDHSSTNQLSLKFVKMCQRK